MILKNIFLNTFTQIRSIFITFMNMFKKRETRLYPDVKTYLSPRYRGRIVLTKDLDGEDRCVACGLCAVVCPVGCISLQKSQSLSGRWFPKFFRINFSRCIFCGLCEEACPTTAIQLIPEFELGDYNRQNLVYEKKELSISGPGKSTNYNFYKTCGISLDKSKNFNATPIDIKSLLL